MTNPVDLSVRITGHSDVGRAYAQSAAETQAWARTMKKSSDDTKAHVDRNNKEIFKIDNAFASVARRMGSRMALMGTAVLGAVGPAVALTDALWPMIGAMGAIPAVAVGGIAGIGALILGFHGLAAALKKSTGGGIDQAAAEKRVTQAQKSAVQAQKDLNDARKQATRDLRDMNLQMARAHLDERSAALAVKDAVDALRQARAGGTREDREKAQIAYEEAQLSLQEIRNRVADLTEDDAVRAAKGVEGSDAVTAALDRQQQALDELAAAQKALSGGGGGTDLAAEAYAKLSDAGKSLVDTFKSLKDGWSGLAKSVQQATLEGVSGWVQDLSDKYLPVMKAQLPGIAKGWNNVFKSIHDTATQSGFVADMNHALGQSGEMWRRVGNAFGPFLDGFRQWVRIGSDFLPRLGSWVDRAAFKFQRWSTMMRESGKGFDWIENAVTVGHELNELFGSWISSVGKIFALGKDNTLLPRLIEGSQAFREWLDTAEGQQRINDMFERFRGLASSIWGVLKQAVSVLNQADVSGFEVVFTTLGQALKVIADNMQYLNPVIKNVIPLVLAFKAAGILAKIATAGFAFTLKALKDALSVTALKMGAFGDISVSVGKHAKETTGYVAKHAKEVEKLGNASLVAAGKTAGAGIALAGLSAAAIGFGASMAKSGSPIEGFALMSIGAMGFVDNIKNSVLPSLESLRIQLGLTKIAAAGLAIGLTVAVAGALYLYQKDAEEASKRTQQMTKDLETLAKTGTYIGQLKREFGEAGAGIDAMAHSASVFARQDFLGSLARQTDRLSQDTKYLGGVFQAVWNATGLSRSNKALQELDKSLVEFAKNGGDVNAVLQDQRIQTALANGQLPDLAQYLKDAAEAEAAAGSAAEQTAASWDKAAQNLDVYMTKLDEYVGGVLGYTDAVQEAEEAQKELDRVRADPNHTVEQERQALEALARAQLNVASAQSKLSSEDIPEALVALQQLKDSGYLSADAFAYLTSQIMGTINAAKQARDLQVSLEFHVTGAEQIAELEREMGRINFSTSGGRASGGPVDAGKAYVVGEEGPEVFVADEDGTIIPNGGSGQPTFGGSGPQEVRVIFDVNGLESALKAWLRKALRVDGPKSYGLQPAG